MLVPHRLLLDGMQNGPFCFSCASSDFPKRKTSHTERDLCVSALLPRRFTQKKRRKKRRKLRGTEQLKKGRNPDKEKKIKNGGKGGGDGKLSDAAQKATTTSGRRRQRIDVARAAHIPSEAAQPQPPTTTVSSGQFEHCTRDSNKKRSTKYAPGPPQKSSGSRSSPRPCIGEPGVVIYTGHRDVVARRRARKTKLRSKRRGAVVDSNRRRPRQRRRSQHAA